MTKKILASVLAVLLIVSVLLCGCGKTDKVTNNITVVPEETVLKVTSDMTRKQLYELFGATAGSATSGTNGFLATYIIASKYVFAISVFDDDDSAIGYDGETLLNSLKVGRSLTTDKGMSVNAEEDFVAGTGDGFLVKVNYDGEYKCSMSGYNITVDGTAITAETVLKGENTLCIDVANPIEPETTPIESGSAEIASADSADESTAPEASGVALNNSAPAVKKLSASSDDATTEEMLDGALVLAAPADDSTTEELPAVIAAPAETTEEEPDIAAPADAATDVAVNKLLGMLAIDNGADSTVYVEIYTIGGETFISRVRY